ncbi:MAG: hypothetical protein CM1200mP3_06200 [Chloroflexota bacterium]|nr:MAG: hypothetical protein CM1200mP3_06200 [Chloroflexota bacterium]
MKENSYIEIPCHSHFVKTITGFWLIGTSRENAHTVIFKEQEVTSVTTVGFTLDPKDLINIKHKDCSETPVFKGYRAFFSKTKSF